MSGQPGVWPATIAGVVSVLGASAAPAEESARPVVVLLVPAEDEAAATALLGAVEAELGDLPVDVAVERATAFPPALPAQIEVAAAVAARRTSDTVFWFDVSLPGQVFVYLAEPGGSRVLVRGVEAADVVERVASAAVIVRGLMKAILEGGTIGIQAATPAPGEPAPEPRPAVPTELPAEPPPIPPAEPATWVGLELAYGLDFVSDQVSLMHGLDAGLLVHVHENWSLFATYRVLFDAEVSGGGMDLDVTRHPVQVGVRFHWPLGDWDVGGSVSGVLDYVTGDVAARSAEVTVVVPDATWLGGFGILAHVSYRIAGTFRVFLDEGLDLFMNRVEYVVGRGDGSMLLFRSWYAAPRLVLGLQVDLL